MWPSAFEERLLEWRALRESTAELPLEEALLAVDTWWQDAPLSLHYLHIDDFENWPDPWDLLADNTYCDLAKCLGICYTLLLLDRDEINDLHIIETDNYFAVEVNNAQVINYCPREITHKSSIPDYDVRRVISADLLRLE